MKTLVWDVDDVLSPLIPTWHWRFAEWTQWFWIDQPHNPVEGSMYLRWSAIVPNSNLVSAMTMPRSRA